MAAVLTPGLTSNQKQRLGVMTGQAPTERIEEPSGSPEAELAAARRWARDMGHVASGAQRRNKRTKGQA